MYFSKKPENFPAYKEIYISAVANIEIILYKYFSV